MKVRNLQKTGTMYYVYLPTKWCKRLQVDVGTKIAIEERSDGSLLLHAQAKQAEQQSLELFLPKEHKDALIPLIMACYLNPLGSFRIKLDKGINAKDIFAQKDLASVLEFVELDDGSIVYDAVMDVRDPASLVKTMMKKVKNLLYLLIEQSDATLINKYEEEIDRTKILVQKSVISSLVLNKAMDMQLIEMNYFQQIAIDMERMVDSVIRIDNIAFLKTLTTVIDALKAMIDNIAQFDHLDAAALLKNVQALRVDAKNEEQRYLQMRSIKLLQNIAEVMMDWSISKQIAV